MHIAASGINGGIAVAPHRLAAQAAGDVMREGGNAIEAMIAAAAAIAVVYPHMNTLGGDGFWLILPPSGDPLAIDASGPAARSASIVAYRRLGYDTIPTRGALAANTVAGTVAGWEMALDIAARFGGRMKRERLLAPAIAHAEDGMPVSRSQAKATQAKLGELEGITGFREHFLSNGAAPSTGSLFRQPRLALTLTRLASEGFEDFYRGGLARDIARDLAAAGSPLTESDLAGYHAVRCEPLRLVHSAGDIYNLGAPTQGFAALAILGLLDRMDMDRIPPDGADHIHLTVEATKLAFQLRDRYITDPAETGIDLQELLDPVKLDALAAHLDRDHAAPWHSERGPGDTVWMGTIDRQGMAVSFIQSGYHEFGSGIVLPATGLIWQNRGASFSLEADHLLALSPGKKPFHTLCPAAAALRDGRKIVYGSMGGDGQPQTQAAVFTRHVVFGQPLPRAIESPRWLLGRTWGEASDTLKLEARFNRQVVDELLKRGHVVEMVDDYDELMGHAGAAERNVNGAWEGAADPRSDGGVVRC
jgi:gamma-glutamyltranspeptidase